MRVHISITDPDLTADRDRIAEAVRDTGTDVSVGDGVTANDIEHADLLICLVGRGGVLLGDGTQLGERAFHAAIGRDIPVIAYELAEGGPGDPADHRDGYALARVEALRRQLRSRGDLRLVMERLALPDMVLRDLARTRGRLRQTVPEAVRVLHGRIRDHPAPVYDALSVSMHNVDHLYEVPTVVINRELSGEYHGAEPGGAGANSMVALRRLGLLTAVAGAVGDDADGAMLRRALEEDEVSTTLLLTVRSVATGRTVMLRDRSGGYSLVVDGGANGHLAAEIERRDIWKLVGETASRSRVLHFSPFSTRDERDLRESLLHAVPDETIVSYKPSTLDAELGIDGLEMVLGRCDVLFVAEAELDLLLAHRPGFRRKMPVSEKLDLLLQWRARDRHVRPLVVAVTAGMAQLAKADPVRLHWGVGRHEGTVGPDRAVPGRIPPLKDGAGARDAIVAGVLFGLLRSRTPIDCVNLANVLAISASAEIGSRPALLRPARVRERWRELLGREPPRWLDPYG